MTLESVRLIRYIAVQRSLLPGPNPEVVVVRDRTACRQFRSRFWWLGVLDLNQGFLDCKAGRPAVRPTPTTAALKRPAPALPCRERAFS